MTTRHFFKKIVLYIKDPRRLYVRFSEKRLRKVQDKLSDEEFIRRKFRLSFGYEPNLENPKTFNEKLNWLKLHDRKPLYTTMVDKHLVKQLVSDLIGKEHVVREYGCFNHYDEINFDKLPEKFVLKTNHGCGGMYICYSKKDINHDNLKNKFENGLKQNYFYNCREWPYKNVAPKIIAEEFLDDGINMVLPVYKFFCFNGEPFIVQVITNDKQENEKIDYFDMNWNKLKLRQNYPNSKHILKAPTCFCEMKSICRKLTKGLAFIRCDLYEANGKIYFSEFTFYSDAGFEPFKPKKWDSILGNKINLT